MIACYFRLTGMASLQKRLESIRLNQDEISAGCDVVNEVLDSLLEILERQIPEREVEKVNTGSYYEGVKVRHCLLAQLSH